MSTTNEQLYFYKGLEAALPTNGIKIGALYHCTDTGNTYRGTSTTTLELYSTRVGKKEMITDDNGNVVYGEVFNDYENNIANGANSHAEGSNTKTDGISSHAEGGNIDTNGAATDWTFEFDDPSGLGPQTFEITGPYAYGNGAHAEGLSTLAYGAGAHSEGLCTLAAGGRSHAEGTGTQALGHRAHAEGGNTTASGKDSHAEGTNTIASGSAAHAEGQNTIALGTYSHVEGIVSIAAGPYTHAEGGSTEARGNYSHAEGWHTVAHNYQHVQGKYNDIGATYSSTSSSGTVEKGTGDNAFIIFDDVTQDLVEGKFKMINPSEAVAFPPSDTKLFTRVQYLCGNDSTTQYFQFNENPEPKYDEESGKLTGYKGKYTSHKMNFTNYAHVIGNGFSKNGVVTRSNAHTVDWSGNAWFAGDVTVGEDKQKLTTESAANALIDTAISKIDYTPILQDYATQKYVDDKAKVHYVVAGRKAETTAGERSTAEGRDTTASGYSAHAEGYVTSALGRASHAEGGYSKTKDIAEYAHAEGNNTSALNKHAHAEGSGTIAGDENSTSVYAMHAEGINTVAKGSASHAEGISTLAEGQASHAEGDAISRTSIGGSRSGPQALGRASHAEGSGTIAGVSGNADICGSHAEGIGSQSLGIGSHAEGYDTKASGKGSHAEGCTGKTTEGYWSYDEREEVESPNMVELSGPKASGQASHAEGEGTWANGEASHAEGVQTEASGYASHAEGGPSIDREYPSGGDSAIVECYHIKGPIASGDYSHAEGTGTEASGVTAHAEGASTIASGDYSHSEGRDTIASGYHSHAEGWMTTAAGANQHVSGRYNITDYDNKYACIVGNGTKETYVDGWIEGSGPSNAYTLDWDGNGWFAGNVYVGGTNQEDALQVPKSLIVTVDGETASHTSTQICEHIQNGGIAYLHYDEWYLPLAVEPGGYVWAILNSDDYTGFHASIGEDGSIYTTDLEYVSSSVLGDRAVLYDKEQKLTPEQQKRACSNIGALKANDDIDMADNDINNVSNIDVHNQINISDSSNKESLSLVPDAILFNRLGDKGFALMSGGYKHNEDTDTTCAVAEFYGIAGDEPTILSNIADGIDQYDAVTKRQLDAAIASVSGSTPTNLVGQKTDEGGEIFNDYENNIATGVNSHAEGRKTAAIGDASHAEGNGTQAIGTYAHSEGTATFASGKYSHAEGCNTTASGEAQHVQGKYNIIMDDNYLHVVGNGTYSNRSNAHTLDKDGNAWFAGDVVANGISIENKETYNESVNIFFEEEEQNRYPVVSFYGGTGDDYAILRRIQDGVNDFDAVNKRQLDIKPGQIVNGTGEIFNDYNNNTADNYSHAEGYNTQASNYSHAEGKNTKAYGDSSHAEGCNTEASTMRAHAEGESTKASGYASHAEGRDTTAYGRQSHAEGYGAEANGNTSHAEGKSTNAYGNYSHAEGESTIAYGPWSHAEGYNTNAAGDISHAEGNNTKASGHSSHAEGYYSEASGSWSHAEGELTIASGHASHAEGNRTNAIGLHSHAQGYQTTSYGGESAAMGFSHNIISQDVLDNSQVDEDGNFIMKTDELERWKANRFETPEDDNSTGFNSLYSLAGGSFSTSEGLDTLALGRSSHSEGNYTIASGMASHAEGSKTEANGFTAHAEGEWTIANSRSSHAEGLGTIANAPGQHAQGMYNILMNSNYLHIVGNGTSDTERSNAHTLDKNGNAWFAGGITADGTTTLNGGLILLNGNTYGDTLPTTGNTKGRIFFKKA